EVYGVPPEKLAVVPEPIDLAEWRRRFARADRRPATRPTVLSVARMYPRKRLADLLQAAVLLRARIPRVQVRIVGEGPESVRLRALHRRLGLGDAVVFLGEVQRTALAVEYMSAHCFCLPTVQEGFGIVFSEAMAAGLPVIACRAAAVPEVVEDGRTGLLVNPESPDALATAMETLLMNEGLRTGMVIDLGELKRIVGETVVERFDHADLCADPLFRGRVPTTENLSVAVWELLAPKLGADRLWQVRVWEDPTLYVDYRGT